MPGHDRRRPDPSPGAAARILPLSCRGVCYGVAGRPLLQEIELELTGGARTVVMGYNGAGKSLLLRVLHGMIPPDRGGVYCAGRLLSDAARRRQAMVFQKPVLLRRSVAQNIDFVLKLRDIADRRGRCEHLLREVGLAEFARDPARRLSGGEQQRLAFARALASGPEVLFLDEPTANLDPASVAAMEELINRAHQRGVKIVLVTHDVGQARRLADEVLFLHRGRVAEKTAAAAFFNRPASAAARAYIEGRILP